MESPNLFYNAKLECKLYNHIGKCLLLLKKFRSQVITQQKLLCISSKHVYTTVDSSFTHNSSKMIEPHPKIIEWISNILYIHIVEYFTEIIMYKL